VWAAGASSWLSIHLDITDRYSVCPRPGPSAATGRPPGPASPRRAAAIGPDAGGPSSCGKAGSLRQHERPSRHPRSWGRTGISVVASTSPQLGWLRPKPSTQRGRRADGVVAAARGGGSSPVADWPGKCRSTPPTARMEQSPPPPSGDRPIAGGTTAAVTRRAPLQPSLVCQRPEGKQRASELPVLPASPSPVGRGACFETHPPPPPCWLPRSRAAAVPACPSRRERGGLPCGSRAVSSRCGVAELAARAEASIRRCRPLPLPLPLVAGRSAALRTRRDGRTAAAHPSA